MKNTHWIDLAYHNLKDQGLPLPEFKFQVSDNWGKPVNLDERFYDDVPLISREDLVGREIRHLGELITINKFDKFRRRFHNDGVSSVQHYIVELNRKNRYLTIELIRGITPLSLESQNKVESYKAFNTFYISSQDEKGENSFDGTFGKDFNCPRINACYRFDKTNKDNFFVSIMDPKEEEFLESQGIDPRQIERQQCLMSPEQWIEEFAVPFVMKVYNELIK